MQALTDCPLLHENIQKETDTDLRLYFQKQPIGKCPNIYTVPEAEFKSSSAMVNPFVSSLLVLIETPKGGEQSNNKEEYSIVANRHSGKFETFSQNFFLDFKKVQKATCI